ncbi:MAG: ribosomal RNA small subunit methyltransferase A [Phycisphaerae bacterium]|nr:ribosomal RNA small subunit methyltransferase A [Phycisphaerae bacterium]
MQSLTDIRNLLEVRGLKPLKQFGQNFLHDQNQIRRLVEAAGIEPGDRVLEIGPGTGALTEALLEAGAEVIACEIDTGLADLVADRFGDQVQLVRGDCLGQGRRLSPDVEKVLGDAPWSLVANLPYQAASPVMIELLMHQPGCRGQFVTIQKEVADRLLASPGEKARGPLGILASTFGTIERIGVIPPSCFWPQPKVVSAMVALRPLELEQEIDRQAYARFGTMLFSSRRKQLGRILGRDRRLPEGIEPSWRPEVLTNEQLIALFRLD